MSTTGSPARRIELSVIAPCFNEAENVPLLVSRLLAVFDRRNIAGEIVLVNDGSTDATGAIIDSLALGHHEVVAVHHARNRGLSAGWDSGLEASKGTYVCFIDADLQNPPEEVWRLYREITQSRADMVQGVRSAIGRLKDERYTASRVLNVMLNLAFGMSAADNKSGFVMALRDTMTDVLRRRFRYRYSHVFIAVAAHARGFTFREVETLFQSRHAGSSFIKRWPVKLVTNVCVDTAKAIVEFRVSPQRIDAFDRFFDVSKPAHEPVREEWWRRLVLEAYFMSLAFQGPLITRRVRQMYHALMRTQWTPLAEMRQLQEVRLRRMVRHAYHHVPYYREAFDRLTIRPDEIQTMADLQRLPLLSKQEISENLYFDLFADNHRKREMQKVTASGAGAEPFDLYVDRMQLEMQLAASLRALGWTGWRFGDRQARLWPDTAIGSWPQAVRTRVEAFLMRRASVPVGASGAGTVERAVRRIRTEKPVLIDGCARSLQFLAEYLTTSDAQSLGAQAAMSSMEILPDDLRRTLQRPLGPNVFDWYRRPEFNGIAHECEAHDGHHVAAESYIVEVLNGRQPARPGEDGEIVVTDLNSFSVPLIRYRTGDRATAIEQTPCRCGRGLPRLARIQQHTRATGSEGPNNRLRRIEVA
jgi:phenylacetate-CoA ligase